MKPDVIAHKLTTSKGEPVKFHLNSGVKVPTEPYRRGTPKTVQKEDITSFTAVVERASIEDGGLNLVGFGGIHLPKSEWERIGFDEHWKSDDVDLESPFTDPHRKLELWGSREENYYERDDEEELDFTHLSNIPDESPVITEWEGPPDSEVNKPPVPFDRPELTLYVLHAEDARDPQGMDRITVGEVDKVEVLDTIDEWPEEPDIDSREVNFPSLHPNIDYEDIDEVDISENVLHAVFTINRYAKKYSVTGTRMYESGDKARARMYSVKKEALYDVKTVALHKLVKGSSDEVTIKLHNINGSEMYCFYIDSYSFHQPRAAVQDELLEEVGVVSDELESESIDYNRSSNTDTGMSLEQALEIIKKTGVSPNEYVSQNYVEDYLTGQQIETTFTC